MEEGETAMKRKLALVAAVAAALSVAPVGMTGTASACPDPDHPCTPMPWQPIPQSQWCKIDPRC